MASWRACWAETDANPRLQPGDFLAGFRRLAAFQAVQGNQEDQQRDQQHAHSSRSHQHGAVAAEGLAGEIDRDSHLGLETPFSCHGHATSNIPAGRRCSRRAAPGANAPAAHPRPARPETAGGPSSMRSPKPHSSRRSALAPRLSSMYTKVGYRSAAISAMSLAMHFQAAHQFQPAVARAPSR